jgi:antitoxin ParD1/3/4
MAYYAIIGGTEPAERVPVPTRNVVLTERQADLIETLVESGRYQNAREVLRDGLRLVEQREAEDASKLKVLRSAGRVGVGALARREFKEFCDIDELRAYLNDLSEKVISETTGSIRLGSGSSPRRKPASPIRAGFL